MMMTMTTRVAPLAINRHRAITMPTHPQVFWAT